MNLTYKATLSELECIVRGRLINSLKWTKDGVPIPNETFVQSQLLLDKITATTRSILFSDFVNFVGEFECEVTDIHGRIYSSKPKDTTEGSHFNIALI